MVDKALTFFNLAGDFFDSISYIIKQASGLPARIYEIFSAFPQWFFGPLAGMLICVLFLRLKRMII